MLPLSTPRLTLRAMAPGDAAALAAYRNDPVVSRYQDWAVPYTLDDAARLIAGQAHLDDPTPGEWLQIAVSRDGEMIGDVVVGLPGAGAVPTIGYTLSATAQGRGYASEAVGALVASLFADLGVHRIVATLDPANTASMRVIEPLGFRAEGVARQSELIRGTWEDDLRMAVLRADYEAWTARVRTPPVEVELAELTDDNLAAVRALSTFRFQEGFVAPMDKSLAQALVPPRDDDGSLLVPWYRAIIADGVVAGFVMVAEPTEHDPDPYLWRLLIDRAHQQRGIGQRTIALLVERLRRGGHPRLMVSWVDGAGGPRRFYERLGFVPTGEIDDGEVVAALGL